jgi:hypothetical protein
MNPAQSMSKHLPYDIDLELIRKLDRNGPRYTSYPSADRFVDTFGAQAYRESVARRNVGGVQRALSIYVHLPFCSTLCFYCACNKIATRDRNKGAHYLEYLSREIDLQSPLFANDRRVEQMHWGGGTPTFFDSQQLGALFSQLRARFDFAPDGEYSIEIDPRTVDARGVAALRAMGFNRMSLGVQDFDPDVQKAVNRIQSEEQTLAVMDAAYAWIAMHLALRGMSALDLLAVSYATHALTMGAIGGLTLGMMTRTARGHTARPLLADGFELAIFVLIQIAALVRVFGGMISPALVLPSMQIAGVFWAVAFGLFALRYWSVLMRPRLDGKPG